MKKSEKLFWRSPETYFFDHMLLYRISALLSCSVPAICSTTQTCYSEKKPDLKHIDVVGKVQLSPSIFSL